MSQFSIPRAGEKFFITNEVVASLPIQLNNLPKNKILLFLAEDTQQANQLYLAWQFFAPEKRVIYLSDWELLPYERFSASQELISERLLALWQMANRQVDVVITSISTAMQKLAPVSFIVGHTFWLKRNQKLDLDVLKQNLIVNGYQHVTQVISAGEFAIRGGIIDLFSMGAENPYRIDLFDDEVDSIRIFDPQTQRSIKTVEEIRLLPAHEFPVDKNAIATFKSRFRDCIESNAAEAQVYRSVTKGLFGGGVEYYLPLFFTQDTATVFDYLPEDTVISHSQRLPEIADRFAAEIKSRFVLAGGDIEYPPLAPSFLFLASNQLQGLLKPYSRIIISKAESQAAKSLPLVAIDRKQANPVNNLQHFLDSFTGRVLLCADSLGRSETILSLLQQHYLTVSKVNSWHDFLISTQSFCLMVCADFQAGFIIPELNLAIITESDLYQDNVRNYTKRRKYLAISDTAFMDLAEINIGDLVVHENHGIGRYLGLTTIADTEICDEFMWLEYAQDAQLYVPVSQLNLISRYAGQKQEQVPLHQLGQQNWNKAKKKALQKAWDTAAELLNIYAQRQLQQGYRYQIDQASYQNFVDGFEYEETEDQSAAIGAVLQDLLAAKPMDRLICGDVGFGKTEVALRAAFVVAMSGRQVALLAPTTLLAEQHAEVFSSRFANLPIKVEQLSRFVSAKKSKEVLENLRNGTVDIVIGTHKLLQADIKFDDLGLLIIDEEHRFGVRQKEQLKKLRINVDILTMTATPIPRTLSMSLEGLRDFSLITTPPSRRLAVKTFVQPFSEASIREAVIRELKRNGQVFFLHNEVATIDNMKDKLTRLIPNARICVAHGQLHERELEHVMREFLRHRYDVMLCSTIIETGIDIPNANTIIINNADKFGIAQLHQLRGRVGRSYHQAYAYLMTPEFISKDARKRLEAIQLANELGAGFYLAMQDLEIRGSGEILGDDQSGEMIKVGLTLYTEMLTQAVADLKRGKQVNLDEPLKVTTEIKLHSPALLPESYCPDIHERLVLYKKLAQAQTNEQIDAILEELIDRFGLPELPVKLLLESHRLRIKAQASGISYIDANKDNIVLTFSRNTKVDLGKIIQLIQTQSNTYQLLKNDKLLVKMSIAEPLARVEQINQLIATII